MISNETVRRLIACDHDALIALMAIAMKNGNNRDFDSQLDPDIRALLIFAWEQNAPPPQMQLINGKWYRRSERSMP